MVATAHTVSLTGNPDTDKWKKMDGWCFYIISEQSRLYHYGIFSSELYCQPG